jgi:hypothetical protein
MNEGLDTLLTEMESVTAEMAAAKDVSLEELSALCGRRKELIERLIGYHGLDQVSLGRVRAVVRRGAEAECRMVQLREALRGELAQIERGRRFANGLASLVPGAGHGLDTQA